MLVEEPALQRAEAECLADERSLTLRLQELTRRRIRLSGALAPPRNGEKVTLQVRTHSGWKTVASVPCRKATGQRSEYTATLGHLSPGVYRAHYGGDSGYRPATARR